MRTILENPKNSIISEIFCSSPKFFISWISFQHLRSLIDYFVIVYHKKNCQIINSLKFYCEYIIF